MLESLEIKNFRSLKELKIPSLKRINLFTGKNNTGKSTILEALAIYTTKGDLGLIFQLLAERGENIRQSETKGDQTEVNLKMLSSMFTDRHIGFDSKDVISIGDFQTENFLFLNFVKNEDGIKIKIDTGKFSSTFPLDRGRFYPEKFNYYNKFRSDLKFDNTENMQFVHTKNMDSEDNGKLFDKIALTDKEQDVIAALKIIESMVEGIAFVEKDSRGRSAVVKLSNSLSPIPLKSMGDGINRILTIILAMVNSGNGFLLIDEFENGLHYTVQKQLWEIIFLLSQKLNVQVFATTHSDDCIKGFEAVLNSSGDNTQKGKLIRLDNKNGTIKPVEFDAKDLKISNKNDIEIR